MIKSIPELFDFISHIITHVFLEAARTIFSTPSHVGTHSRCLILIKKVYDLSFLKTILFKWIISVQIMFS